MTALERVLAEAIASLEERPWGHALVGGLAVSARIEPRFTRDIDLAISVRSDEEAESVVRSLQGRGFRATATVEQESTGRLATARLLGKGESIVVDLMFASSGIEPEVVLEADRLEVFPDLTISVAGLPHLLALKILSRDDRERPQDRMDAVALARASSPEQRERARQLLGLIEQRGCSRGRDLLAGFARLLEEAGID